jgi:hypothetical protein
MPHQTVYTMTLLPTLAELRHTFGDWYLIGAVAIWCAALAIFGNFLADYGARKIGWRKGGEYAVRIPPNPSFSDAYTAAKRGERWTPLPDPLVQEVRVVILPFGHKEAK